MCRLSSCLTNRSDANEKIVQGEFDLTLLQDGILPAAFMLGLLLASLGFAELSQHFNAMRLMGTPACLDPTTTTPDTHTHPPPLLSLPTPTQ